MSTTTPEHLPLEFARLDEVEMIARSRAFYEQLRRRHSVREFSSEPVPDEVIRHALLTAGTAPNGANLQPWHFVVVRDAALKRAIRVAAEREEQEFYAQRAPQPWLDALAPLGTDANKPFLELAPCLIVIFAQAYGVNAAGERVKHYYVPESVGIATGFLIAALHQAGLACLTHTPSPMNFLGEILERPKNERAYINLVVGYPVENATYPAHAAHKKPLSEIATFK